MIPLSSVNSKNGIKIVVQPSLSYKIKSEKERIEKNIDGIEAVKQSIYKVLMTERYKYLIYNWNYGIELEDLFGKPKSTAVMELPERIKDALKPDDRIKEVYDFEFNDIDKTTLAVKFKVKTIFGDSEIDWQVNL